MGFATVSHELHRIRRSALNPYFSKRSIAEYAPVIQGVVDKFCTRLDEATRTGELVNLKYAYAAVSTDVINEYCYSRTYNAVLAPDFNIGFYESIMALSQLCHVVSIAWFGDIVTGLMSIDPVQTNAMVFCLHALATGMMSSYTTLDRICD